MQEKRLALREGASQDLFIVNALDALADAGEHLIGYRIEPMCKLGYGERGAEDFYTVAFVAIDISDIDHAHVHADISDIRCSLTAYETIPPAEAEATAEPISITYWQRGYTR